MFSGVETLAQVRVERHELPTFVLRRLQVEVRHVAVEVEACPLQTEDLADSATGVRDRGQATSAARRSWPTRRDGRSPRRCRSRSASVGSSTGSRPSRTATSSSPAPSRTRRSGGRRSTCGAGSRLSSSSPAGPGSPPPGVAAPDAEPAPAASLHRRSWRPDGSGSRMWPGRGGRYAPGRTPRSTLVPV